MKKEELSNKISRLIRETGHEVEAFQEARSREAEESQAFLRQWRDLCREVILPVFGEIENNEKVKAADQISVTVRDGQQKKMLVVNDAKLAFSVNIKTTAVRVEGDYEDQSFVLSDLTEAEVRNLVYDFFEAALRAATLGPGD